MVTLISRYINDRHAGMLTAIHAAGKRVIVDLLGSPVPCDGSYERDALDMMRQSISSFVIRVPAASLRRRGCSEPIARTSLASSSRSFAKAKFRAARLAACKHLVRALVEYALLSGVRFYTAAAEIGWLREFLAAGWDVRPLSLPQGIGGCLLRGLKISITSQTSHRRAPDWRCEARPTRIVEFDLPLAA